MAAELVGEILIPAEEARAFIVKKGQTMRVIEIEGPQAGDMAIFNANDYKEIYDPDVSYLLNCATGTGTPKRIKTLYSRPPRMNIMFNITEDKVGVHWCLCGGRCNQKIYELRYGVKGYHRNCQDNLAEAISSFGLTPEDVPDVFNLFQNVDMPEDGPYQHRPTGAKKGDYIDLLAHMDCLVALSACPANDVTPIGDYDRVNRPLKVEIWE